METKKVSIVIPAEAHEWLKGQVRELQQSALNRVSLGDVVLDVIYAIQDHDAVGSGMCVE
jgi:hypothetical protein